MLISENIRFNTKASLILLMSTYFLQKISIFLAKMVPLLKATVWELWKRFFSSVCSFCKLKSYCWWKCKFYRLCVQNLAFGLFQIGQKLKNINDVTISQHDLIAKIFDLILFFLSSLVTGPSSMSISSLILELWHFSFIRDWQEIRKSEIPPSEFCPISRDWGESEIPNLAQMSLIKCYWMLQNARVTAFTVSELLRENQQGAGGNYPLPPPPTTQIRVNCISKVF